MAKKKASRQRAVIPSVPVAAPLIPLGRTIPITVAKASAEDVTLTLSDGTKLKLRPMIMSIERSTSKYNVMGEPIYQVQAGFVIQTIVPKKLKRKVMAP